MKKKTVNDCYIYHSMTTIMSLIDKKRYAANLYIGWSIWWTKDVSGINVIGT